MTKPARLLGLTVLELVACLMASAASQTITFDAIPSQIFGVSPFVIAAQASSGLPVTFTSTTPVVCKTASNLVMLLRAGPCFITASQSGNSNYSAAASVTRSFTTTAAKPSGALDVATGSPVAAGTNPVSMAIGDFNGDGIQDFVVANTKSNNVTILFGNGSGTYSQAPGSPFAVETNPAAVVAGDFNGDGNQDVAVSGANDGTITVLLGNGIGEFTIAPGSPFVAGAPVRNMAIGDFNSDGIPDLAAANSNGPVAIFLGNGSGSFTAAASSPFTAGIGQGILTIGDFNGDGNQDIAVTNNFSNTVTILLGNGSGGFTGSTLSTGQCLAPTALTAADFNGDGILDLAVGCVGAQNVPGGGQTYGYNLAVLLGNGSGGFTGAPGPYTTVPPASLVAGDFNGDGYPDLAVIGSVATTILPGDGTGRLSTTVLPFLPGGISAVAADLNQDGLLDLAIANNGLNALNILLGGLAQTNGALTATASTLAIGQSVVLSLAVSDTGTAFAIPTGTVNIYDGTTLLGSAGQATSPYAFTTSSLSVGSHALTAIYSGDSRSSSSTSNAVAIQVLQTQTIAFPPMNNVAVGSAPFSLTATATSGLAVTFTSNTPTVCTVSGSTLTIVGAGTCSITASQAGSATYAAATPVTQNFISGPVYQLTAAVSPSNSGTITISPASTGNNYVSGSTVCLSASPAAGQVFTGWTGTALNAAGCLTMTGSASVTANFETNPVSATSALRFVPATPCRLVDTRNPSGPVGGPAITGGNARSFTIPGACNIPSTALAYSLNLTVVPHGTLGYVTMWPTGQTQPVVSTLNSLDGRIKSNAAIVPARTGGAVSVYATDTTDAILDINGYFDSYTDTSALQFYPLTPCRVADTRSATGSLGGPSLVGSQSRSFPIMSSACGIPGNALAYSLNFTAIPQGPLGYLTVWPSGQSQPVVSTLNAPTGAITANAAIVPAGTGGAIQLFATDNSDMAIDINGYFAAPAIGGLSLYNLTPCRIEDTRNPSGTPAFTGTVTETATGVACGVPPEAQSLVLNATVVPSGALGYISLWANGGSQPLVSTLNALDGSVTSNMAVVPTTNGLVNAYAAGPGSTYVILDISGYFAP